ncbi:MAG: FtsH protease activity modulator HflK [bacterium]
MEEEKISWHYIIFTCLIGIGLLLNLLGIYTTVLGIDTAIILTLIGGYNIFWSALSNLWERRISVDLAIAIAAIAALSIKQYLAAGEVIFIMLVGEALEMYAVDKTRSAISKLMELAPKEARVKKDDGEKIIPLPEIRPGDVIIVKSGDRIPVDGKIIKGSSHVDQSSLTGESMPVEKSEGDTVYSGTINQVGYLEISTEIVGEGTILSKIIHLVEEAQEKKAPIQKTADKYARYFVPIILLLAALTYFISGDIVRSVAVLIIACPCALVLATPTAVAAGIGRLAKEGILVKGGVYLEEMGEINSVFFDKTGTITEGKPHIIDIFPVGENTRQSVLGIAAAAEEQSEHLFARLIVEQTKAEGIQYEKADKSEIRTGRGIIVTVGSHSVLVGNERLLQEENIILDANFKDKLAEIDKQGKTPILVAKDGKIAGVITIADKIRPEAEKVIQELKKLKIQDIVLLTGDNEIVGQVIAQKAGIDHSYANLLPDEKVKRIKEAQENGRKVIMVGDGINDAPSLSVANVGISMSGVGTDIAVEAADVIFMSGDLTKMGEALKIGRKTVKTIKQNIIWFAVIFNLIAVVFAATATFITPAWAAVVHQISSLLVCTNSLLLLSSNRIRKDLKQKVYQTGTSIGQWWSGLLEKMHENRRGISWATLCVLIGIYLLSGLYIIKVNQVGVEQRFGKLISGSIGSGLHYSLPWPVSKITKLQKSIDRIEVGFSSKTDTAAGASTQPIAYEWDIQHRLGTYQNILAESQMFTGDENFIDCDIIVQYKIKDPKSYLFAINGVDKVKDYIRCSFGWILRKIVGSKHIDEILTTDRAAIEKEAQRLLQSDLDRFNTGIEITGIYLRGVHPPLDIADAFREVVNADEEKSRLINEAQAYANEQIPLARANAVQKLDEGFAYKAEKINRGSGEALRFTMMNKNYLNYARLTDKRFYLEAMENSLPKLKKFIMNNKEGGHKSLFLLDSMKMEELLGLLNQSISGRGSAEKRKL